MGISIGILAAIIIGIFLPTEEMVYNQELCKISDDAYLKIDNIDGTDIYYYMINTEKDVELKQLATNDVTININEEIIIPKIAIHENNFIKPWYGLFGVNIHHRNDYTEIIHSPEINIL